MKADGRWQAEILALAVQPIPMAGRTGSLESGRCTSNCMELTFIGSFPWSCSSSIKRCENPEPGLILPSPEDHHLPKPDPTQKQPQ